MSAFPYFSNIAGHVQEEFKKRKGNQLYVSTLNCWIRLSSGVGSGCMIYSNPNYPLFKAMGSTGVSIYGNNESSGTIGVRWNGKTAVAAGSDFWGFRPPPIITSVQIDEGAGALSRKAEISITAYTIGQLNTLCKYYLEPGYTIFIEFGWNTKNGVSQYVPALDANYVGAHQSFAITHKRRTDSKGHYDNYLGFITGGSVAMSGDTWTLTIKCTGFTELPAFLNVADNSEPVEKNTELKGNYFKPTEINAETDLGKKRFMMAFNKLPSNKQSQRVANLINDKTIADYRNFINVDEYVKENINDTTSGTEIFGFSLNDEEIKSEDKEFEVPSGTKIIGDESFIRFGTLMQIINCIGVEGVQVGNVIVKNYVNTENTVCSAFQRMFSTDKSKLLIPNDKMPFFSVFQARTTDTPQTDLRESADNKIDNTIIFPSNDPIIKGAVGSKRIQYTGSDIGGISKGKGQWGYLDYLYVNMDFARGILETKNFLVKDALYQILNGMSSAAGGVWDFQIQEANTNSGASTELTVVDMNFIPDGDAGMSVLDAVGVNSIFIDANLDLDISGAKMNQVIAKRLGVTQNSSASPVDIDSKRGLFTDEKDIVLQGIKKSTKKTTPTQVKTEQPPKEATTAEKIDKLGKDVKDVVVNQTFAPTAQERNVLANVAVGQFNTVTGVFNSVVSGVASFFGSDAVAKEYGEAARRDFAEADESFDEALNDAGVAFDKVVDATVQVGKDVADATGITALKDALTAYFDKEEAKEKNFQSFLDKVGIYPRVEKQATDTFSGAKIEDIAYIVCYNDQLAFESLKNGHDNTLKNKATVNISALMPIKFTFTVHGVSGIKRGDKFKVRGIPTQYEMYGFFQVTAVKQIIEGMTWKTEVEGQFRLAKNVK